MRRRLVRLLVLGVALPAAARAAVLGADRLEATKGPSTASRSLRRAAILVDRRWR